MRLMSVILFFLFWLPVSASWCQQLSCTPCSHSFGRVKVGTSASFSIQLTNTGSKSLRIVSKADQGGEFHYGSFPLPVTLLPRQTILLRIIFKPTALGYVRGTFTLASTALNPTLSLPVAGAGVSGAQLTLSPTSLNFGNVTVGNSVTRSSTLTASGGDVTISSDRLTSSEFALVGLNPPMTIPSGQSIQVKIKFTPGQSGTASGKAGYFSNSLVSPTVELLTGTGVAQTAHNVTLTWHAPGSSVVGYNIYRGTAHGGPYQRINNALDASTNYIDYLVGSGKTYYYVTTALDSSGEESPYSNETSAVIPSP